MKLLGNKSRDGMRGTTLNAWQARRRLLAATALTAALAASLLRPDVSAANGADGGDVTLTSNTIAGDVAAAAGQGDPGGVAGGDGANGGNVTLASNSIAGNVTAAAGGPAALAASLAGTVRTAA